MPPLRGFFFFQNRMNNNEQAWAIVKGLIAWAGALIGSITLSKLVLFATFVFTTLQTYVLVRDKLWPRRHRSRS